MEARQIWGESPSRETSLPSVSLDRQVPAGLAGHDSPRGLSNGSKNGEPPVRGESGSGESGEDGSGEAGSRGIQPRKSRLVAQGGLSAPPEGGGYGSGRGVGMRGVSSPDGTDVLAGREVVQGHPLPLGAGEREGEAAGGPLPPPHRALQQRDLQVPQPQTPIPKSVSSSR